MYTFNESKVQNMNYFVQNSYSHLILYKKKKLKNSETLYQTINIIEKHTYAYVII